MKKTAFFIVIILTISILAIAIVSKNQYDKIPNEASKLFEKNKNEMLSLAKKQVDSLFVNGSDTKIYPLYHNCKSRYVDGNPWENSGTAFREILYPTNYKDRLPKDIISTYHFAPENPDYKIGSDIIDGIKTEIILNSIKKEKITSFRVNWKGMWQSGWALGVNECWDGSIVQYIIIPYAISFRKQNHGIFGDYYTIDSALESAYQFLTESPQSKFKDNIVPYIDKFIQKPYINNEYYYLSPTKENFLVPRTAIAEGSAYDFYIENDYYYVFIRAFGIKKYNLVIQEEHVDYLKETYIDNERQSIKDFCKKACSVLGVLLIVFLFLFFRELKRKKQSFLQRMVRLCNPKQFIDNYNREKLEVANKIYNQALQIGENDTDAIVSLSKNIEEKLGLYVISKSEIKELKERANPKHFMNPYNSEKVTKANELYATLNTDKLSFSDYMLFMKQISELYDNGDNIKTGLKQSEATDKNKSVKTSSELTSTKNVIGEKEKKKEEANYGKTMTNKTPSQTKYDYGVYDEKNNNDITWDGFWEFIVAAIKILGVFLLSLLVLILSLMYLRAFYLGCLLSITSGILGFYLIKKFSRKKDDTPNKSKEEESPLYYIGIILFFIILLFVCFKNGGSRLLKNINTPSPSKLEMNDDHKEEVEKKSNKPTKQKVRTVDSYDNKKTFKDFDSQMKTIDGQMKMIEEKEKISKLPSEYDNYY